MRAVVLVGGEGTRLRPLTLTAPKQMLPVAGRPMIERVLGHLASHGVDEVILSLGYRPDVFLDAYPDDRCGGVRLRYAVEPEPLDTAGAIAFAADTGGITECFLVANGDVITDLDISALVAFHERSGGEGTVALTPVEDPSAFGVVPVTDDGRVVAFIEKPPRDEAPTNMINAGTYVLEPAALDRIPRGRRVSVERETFPAMVADGVLFAMGSEADWLDAGTPAKYLEANLAMARRQPVAPGAGVHQAATVVDSVVGQGSVVESGAQVERSVLFPGVRVGTGAVIRDSILGREVNVGPGAVVADLSVLGDGWSVDSGQFLTGVRLPS